MNITCEKTGFKKTIYVVDETIVGATFGNIILGGGIGFLVDATTGAAQEYPTLVRFPLEPDDSASQEVKEAYEKARQELARDKEKKQPGIESSA